MTVNRDDFIRGQGDRSKTQVEERAEYVRDPHPGKKALTVWLNPAAVRQFKALAFNLERTQQMLLSQALNELFKKHSLPEIA